MKISTQVVVELGYNERKCFEQADRFITNLKQMLPQGDLISQTTGECVSTAELGRVLGILSGFAESADWTFVQSDTDED